MPRASARDSRAPIRLPLWLTSPHVPTRNRSTAKAALAVSAIGGSLLFIASRNRQVPATAPATATATPPTGVPDAAEVQAAATAVEEAQQKLEAAIGRLQEVADASLQAMDPKTAATLQKNIGIIDQAIAEERAAVKAEPMNVPARESLFEALKRNHFGALSGQGLCHLALGQHREAAALFRRTLAVHPHLDSGRANLRAALNELVKWN